MCGGTGKAEGQVVSGEWRLAPSEGSAMGQEGIPQGLKPAFVATFDAWAKAQAYLRSNSNNEGEATATTKEKQQQH
jgi:hypothetical protein